MFGVGESGELRNLRGMSDLQIHKMELGPIGTNAFLLWEDGKQDAVLIDVPPLSKHEIDSVLADKGLKVAQIWLTHGHWDHMAGAWEFAGAGVEVIGHRADEIMFRDPGIMSGFSVPGMELKPVAITRWVEDGDEMELWGRKVTVFHCPGHCPGNVTFYFEQEQVCFVGDVIFSGSIGRTDLPGGDFSDLEKSIREKIYRLPDETRLGVGHGPDTTVGQEKQTNPFVRP